MREVALSGRARHLSVLGLLGLSVSRSCLCLFIPHLPAPLAPLSSPHLLTVSHPCLSCRPSFLLGASSSSCSSLSLVCFIFLS